MAQHKCFLFIARIYNYFRLMFLPISLFQSSFVMLSIKQFSYQSRYFCQKIYIYIVRMHFTLLCQNFFVADVVHYVWVHSYFYIFKQQSEVFFAVSFLETLDFPAPTVTTIFPPVTLIFLLNVAFPILFLGVIIFFFHTYDNQIRRMIYQFQF